MRIPGPLKPCWKLDEPDGVAYFLVIFTWLFPPVALIGSVYLAASPIYDEPPPQSLHAEFHASHPSVGEWQLVPVRCMSGYEHLAAGIIFQFPQESPIRELRVVDKNGDSSVTLTFSDGREPLSVPCLKMDSEYETRGVYYKGRTVASLKGYVRVACPSIGLEGQAAFDGCWPALSAARVGG